MPAGQFREWWRRLKRVRLRPTSWRKPRARHPGPQTLVLTATITPPPDAWRLARVDPELRRADYLESLRSYLAVDSSIVSKIVFVENSNSDLADFHELVRQHGSGKTVELLSLYGLDYPASYTRGYGEFKLLDAALEASPLLRSLPADAVFWKITGRYRVQNLPSLFANAPASFALYADLRLMRQYFDTRVFAATIAGYRQYLRGTYTKFDRRRCEDVLYEDLLPLASQAGFVGAMNVQPVIEGVNGANNRLFDSGFWRFTRAGRLAVNRLLPFVWY